MSGYFSLPIIQPNSQSQFMCFVDIGLQFGWMFKKIVGVGSNSAGSGEINDIRRRRGYESRFPVTLKESSTPLLERIQGLEGCEQQAETE